MPTIGDEITRTLLRIGRRAQALARPSGNSGVDGRIGRQYGNYRVIKRLGAGGMGRVYLALDTRLGRHVALKFLPPELAEDADFLARFEEEAKTASALNHPNIITIFEFAEIDGELILVSEFIEGTTLRWLLDHQQVPFETAQKIVSQIGSALKAAHAAGVVHRDLKPSNVMLRPDGYVKVIDFGLAKAINRSRETKPRDWTKPGSIVGTVDYLSPEQARGEEIDHRTDLWSLGIILYELLAGCRPFQGTTDSHVIVGILDREPAPITPGENVPAPIAAIVERALQKDRRKRYQSGEELLADLDSMASQVTAARGHRKLWRRRSWAGSARLAGISLLVFAGISGLCWFLFRKGDLMMSPSWFSVATSRQVTDQGDISAAALSPDGKLLAYTSGSGESELLHVRDFGTGSERQLAAGGSGEFEYPSFSRDSKTLYYLVEQHSAGRLFSVPPEKLGAQPSQLILENARGPIAFSPSGHQIAFVRWHDRANADATVGTEESIMLADDSNPRNARPLLSAVNTQIDPQLGWSPDDRWIATVSYPARLNAPTRPTVSLLGLDGSTRKMFVPTDIRNLFQPVVLDEGALLLFSGVPEGAQQRHLIQLRVRTGEFRDNTPDLVGFDQISASTDNRTLASVRMDQSASLWLAQASRLESPQQAVHYDNPIPEVAWNDSGELIFPATQSGNVNLFRLNKAGVIAPTAGRRNCVENFPAAVPHSRRVVYTSNCAHGADDFNIWIMDLTTGSRRPLTSGSSYDYQPDVSPDGKWTVYTSWSSNASTIWKLAVEGGIPLPLSRMEAKLPFFSPDGSKLVCQIRNPSESWRVAILSADDGSVLRTFSDIPAGSLPVRWSPDGDALDFVRTRGQISELCRRPLNGGSAKRLMSVQGDAISWFAWSPEGDKIAYIRSRTRRDVMLYSRAMN